MEEPDHDSVAWAVQSLVAAIRRSIQSSSDETQQSHPQAEDQSLRSLCRITRHVYRSVLKGLCVIGPGKGDDNDQGFPALSGVVRLFQTILGRLHKCALDEYVRTEEGAKSGKKRRRTAPKAVRGAALIPSPGHASQAKFLTTTLVRMLTDLDASNDVHCELLEGLLCAFLDHLGSSLSLLVFRDSNRDSTDAAGILPPQGLLDVAHLDLEAATGSATSESPYLIFILRRAMEFLHSSTNSMSKDSLSLFSLQKTNNLHTDGLRHSIGQTLQNTLLRGVYGDDDDTFYNALRRDEDLDVDEADFDKTMEESKPEEDGAEWFIAQLWEHLGWDILSGRNYI